MSSRAVIFSAPLSAHYGFLEFREPRHLRGYFTCTATLNLDGDEWSVGLDMIEPYRADMLGFFEELARDAPGWYERKEWESEFDEISVLATPLGDEMVQLDIHIRWPPTYEDEKRGSLLVRADDLSQLANAMRSFLGLREGSRFRRFP
jgi:hypothetical protein